MAILAAVLVPTVVNKVKDADDSATASDLSAILSDISYKVAAGTALVASGEGANKPADTKTIKVTTWSDASVVIEVTFKTSEKAKTVTGNDSARDGTWTLTYTPNTGAKVWAPPAQGGNQGQG